MRLSIIIILLLFIFNSCTQNIDLFEPEYTDGSILTGTTEIPEQIKSSLEGIYKISKGADNFGTEVAFKWHDEKLFVYGSNLGTYFTLNAGTQDTSFLFEGTWRHMRNVDVGLLRLKIGVEEGALKLWNNSVTPNSIKLIGSFGFNEFS